MEKEREIPRLEDLERICFHAGTPNERWEWRIKGTLIRHHPYEPAVQYRDGDWSWKWMDKTHRWDGPATNWKGEYQYWIHGRELSREDWENGPCRWEWLSDRINGI